MSNDEEYKENISPENMNKTYYEFIFNSIVDILSIKWVLKCEKLPNNLVPNLSQSIFINPIHNFLLGIGNLINYQNAIIKNTSTGLYNGISVDDAKIMVKCNYLGKKVGFTSSLIDLLSCSSYVVNGIKNSINDRINEEDEDKKAKKKQQINKKNKYWGPMKHRKGEKIIFCEETEDKVIQSGPSDILMSNEIDNAENEGILSQKESSNVKDKKKKKKHFI